MTLATVKVLPVPVAPSSVWTGRPWSEPVDELVDGLRLVAGRLEIADQLKLRGHRHPSSFRPSDAERESVPRFAPSRRNGDHSFRTGVTKGRNFSSVLAPMPLTRGRRSSTDVNGRFARSSAIR